MKIRNKILSGILAITVIGTGAFMACEPSGSTTNEQLILSPLPSTNESDENAGTIGGLALTVSEIVSEDYVAYNVSSEALKAYTVEAWYAPSYVTIEAAVDWGVKFVDPTSEWATGKTVTDYITVTPESDGALTATVECLKEFGSDIYVTVTLRANEKITATCLCVWVHKDDDGGDDPTSGGNSGGDSSSSGGNSGGSSSGGNTGGDSSSSGGNSGGSSSGGNTGGDSGSSSDTPNSTDNRYDEVFEGNTWSGQWGDIQVEMPVYNGTICLDDEFYQSSNAFGELNKRYFMICCVENYEENYDFMQADSSGGPITWADWIAQKGGSIGTTENGGYLVSAYVGDDNCVYIKIHNTDIHETQIYRIVNVRGHHLIGWNFYNVEYVGIDDDPFD